MWDNVLIKFSHGVRWLIIVNDEFLEQVINLYFALKKEHLQKLEIYSAIPKKQLDAQFGRNLTEGQFLLSLLHYLRYFTELV